MALSGSFYTNVNSHWRLQLEWSATQSVANNQSTITAKMYWIALDGYGAINSSATKTSAIQHDGGSWSTESSAGMAGLNGNQKKLINTYTFTLTHDADGTKNFTLDGYFDAEVTLSGTYYGRVNLTAKTFTLNAIPRYSALSSSDSWTAGSDTTISIKRYSSAFRHEVEIYVKNTAGNWDWIKQVAFTTSETSKSTAFTVEQNRWIFLSLNGRSSTETRMSLQTFEGDELIGVAENYGTLSAPLASTTNWGGDFNIGEIMSGTIQRNNSNFTHTIELIFGGTTYTIQDKIPSLEWSYDTSVIASELYAKTANSKNILGEIRIFTYYEGELVRTYNKSNVTAYVTNSYPTFGAGYTYRESNPDALAITENDAYLIQGFSTTLVEIPVTANAIPKNSATMKSYVITLNGVSKPLDFSSTETISVDFGIMTAGSDATLTIEAIDSRGFSTTTSKTVLVIPYSQPVVTTTAARLGDFEADTILTMSGSISLLDILGVVKNDILSMQYRWKERSIETWGEWNDFAYTENGENYSATDLTLILDSTKAFDIEVQTTDKLTTTIISLSVAVGKPIFFIDSKLNSLGFNDVPLNPNEFMFNGRFVFGANMWGTNANGFGALFMNNSDITGANGIWFNDYAQVRGEGLLFPRSTTPEGSTVVSEHDNLYVADGHLYLNETSIASEDVTWQNLTLQNGAVVNNTRTPKFQKTGNLVVLIGEVENKTGVIGTLPVGFRPKQYPLNFKTAMATGAAVVGAIVTIGMDGSVNILAVGNSTSGISLAGITFMAG